MMTESGDKNLEAVKTAAEAGFNSLYTDTGREPTKKEQTVAPSEEAERRDHDEPDPDLQAG